MIVWSAKLVWNLQKKEDRILTAHIMWERILLARGYRLLKAKVLEKKIPETLETKNRKGFYYVLFSILILLGAYALLCLLIENHSIDLYQYVLLFLAATPILVGITP